MNERQKYINDLSIYLRQLADEERNDALEFYDEYIADAGLETRTAIEERLGTPRQLSHKILADYSIKANNESIKEGHPASPHSSWLLVGASGNYYFPNNVWTRNCRISTIVGSRGSRLKFDCWNSCFDLRSCRYSNCVPLYWNWFTCDKLVQWTILSWIRSDPHWLIPCLFAFNLLVNQSYCSRDCQLC